MAFFPPLNTFLSANCVGDACNGTGPQPVQTAAGQWEVGQGNTWAHTPGTDLTSRRSGWGRSGANFGVHWLGPVGQGGPPSVSVRWMTNWFLLRPSSLLPRSFEFRSFHQHERMRIHMILLYKITNFFFLRITILQNCGAPRRLGSWNSPWTPVFFFFFCEIGYKSLTLYALSYLISRFDQKTLKIYGCWL